MKRWHQEFAIAKRNWQDHQRLHIEENKRNSDRRIGQDPSVVDCECDEQIGRFRKRDAYCSKTRCSLCKGHKLPKRTQTAQEIMSELSFAEQLKDLLASPSPS